MFGNVTTLAGLHVTGNDRALEARIATQSIHVPRRGRQHLFRGGLVFEAHTLLHHSTLGLRVIKQYMKKQLGA